MKAVTLKKYFSLSIFMIVLGMNVNVLACKGLIKSCSEEQICRADHNCDQDRSIKQYIAIQTLRADVIVEGEEITGDYFIITTGLGLTPIKLNSEKLPKIKEFIEGLKSCRLLAGKEIEELLKK